MVDESGERLSKPFLQALADVLRELTEASRVTFRLSGSGGLLLATESLAKDIPSMTTGPREDPTIFPTYEFLERERDLLIQEDTRTHAVRPPDSLIHHYNVLAQMLAPIVVDGRVAGVVSVHQVGETRSWTASDVATLRTVQATVARLHAGGTPD